jgi:acetyltransferase-like isoleucine patch superfamily enzyme
MREEKVVLRENSYDLSKLKSVGDDVYINSMSEIVRPSDVEIGSHVAIDFGFFISTKANIGDFIHIGPHVSAIGGESAKLVLASLTSIAAGVRLICYGDEHKGAGIVGALIPEKYQDKRIGGQIEVREFAAIGTNAVIGPGVILGEGCVIAANSYVNQNTEPWLIYGGNPARVIGSRPRENIINFAKEMGYLKS